MAKYIGRLVNLGIARETARGTFVSPTYLVPKSEFTFDDKVTKARSDAGVGRIEDSEEAFVISRYGQGDITGEVRVKSIGLLLYGMLGSCNTTGPTDSAYTHAFSIANTNQHTSLSFLVSDSNTTEAYKLAMLDSLELTQEVDAILKYTASFMSKKGNTSAVSQAALVNESKFTKSHFSLKAASNIAGLSGATALSVKSCTLTISKNVILDEVLGTAEPEDILNRQLSVEGEIVLNYEDETWKNYFTAGTARSLELKWVNKDVTIGSATNPSLTIQLPLVDFMEWEPNYGIDDIVSQTISFKASYDSTNSLAAISTCSLVNAVTSY